MPGSKVSSSVAHSKTIIAMSGCYIICLIKNTCLCSFVLGFFWISTLSLSLPLAHSHTHYLTHTLSISLSFALIFNYEQKLHLTTYADFFDELCFVNANFYHFIPKKLIWEVKKVQNGSLSSHFTEWKKE